MPHTVDRPRASRALSVLFLILVTAPLLAGCLRAQVSMGVSANDRVSGTIIAATVPTTDADAGPVLRPPDSLSSKVSVEQYKMDGYVGEKVTFTDLTFGEVQQLASLSDKALGSYELTLTRSGDLVTLAGQVDLTALPVQGSDVQFTVAFPTRVATTNGTRDGDNVITWKLPAGDSTTLRAEVRYPDPNTRSFAGWAGIVGGVTIGVAAIIGAMAYLSRNAPVGRRRE